MGCHAPLQHQRRQVDTSTDAPARQAPPCRCAGCHHALGNLAVQRLLAGAQPKLKISEPGDAAEHEADRVASAALAGRPGAASLPPTPSPAGSAASPVGASFATGGAPLDRATRADMESRLGLDFGAVRVHTVGEAAASSDALEARAYTVGQDIVFAPGEYRPNDAAGRHLLAHELVHTVQQREGAPRLQRTVKPLAGRCVPDEEAAATGDDDATRAGRAAHQQIQQFFSMALLHEVPLPRGTKDRRGARCPPRNQEDGSIDLWQYQSGYAQIAEIKSVTGPGDAVPSVMHYIRRFYQLVSRMTGGECTEKTADEKDVIFDMLYLNGDLTLGNRKPEPMPLDSVVPMVKTPVGPFMLDPEKILYCQLHPGGAVLYWCNKKEEDEDEDESASEGMGALRTLTLATEKAATKSAEKAAEKAAVGQASEKLAEKAVAEKTTEKAMSRAATRAAAEKTAESMATRKVTETTTEKAAVKAAERAGTRTALETTKKAATSWAGRTLKFLGPLAARANLWLTAAELTLALAGGLAKYGYGSMYAGTRGYLLQQAFKRIAQSSGALVDAANHAVERVYQLDLQLDLQAGSESKTRQLRDEIFDALYKLRVALWQALRSLTHNGYSERYSAIDKHIDVRGQGHALAVSQLEVADGLIAEGDRSADNLELLCSYLIDVTEWQMATVERIFAARDAIVKEDISLWLAIKP